MTTKAERDAQTFWCEEHDRWFIGREGCQEPRQGTPGTCQVCGRITYDPICYSGPHCKEAGGGEVM